MVRPSLIRLILPCGLRSRRARPAARWVGVTGALVLCGGCALAPQSQVDECHQLSRTLRSENARLKDQLLVAQAQNRDYAERAEDDSRRLARQDEAIERFESSVRGYQDERARLEQAYHQLASSLGESRAKADERLSQASPAPPAKKKSRTRAATVQAADDRGDRDQEGARK
jgi:chromosome segregation ATPase